MFVWECIKTEGKHLGTCVDGFLFGSCCGHNDTSNSIEPPFVSRPPPPPQSPSSSSPSFSSSSSASPWPSSSSSSHHHFSPAWTSQVSSLSPPTSKPTQPPYHSTYQSYPSKPTSPPTPPPTTTPSPTTTTTTTTTTKSPAHSQPQKPWPTAASPVHGKCASASTALQLRVNSAPLEMLAVTDILTAPRRVSRQCFSSSVWPSMAEPASHVCRATRHGHGDAHIQATNLFHFRNPPTAARHGLPEAHSAHAAKLPAANARAAHDEHLPAVQSASTTDAPTYYDNHVDHNY